MHNLTSGYIDMAFLQRSVSVGSIDLIDNLIKGARAGKGGGGQLLPPIPLQGGQEILSFKAIQRKNIHDKRPNQ